MGLQIPNSSFVHPDSAERKVFIKETVKQILAINRKTVNTRSIGQVLDERSFVNAIVGLHATGGSTNHLLHLPAMASAAGIKLLWEDFEEVSKVVPLIARIYPNGQADVNEFHKAGGMSFVLQELMDEGFLDPRAQTSWGNELADSYNTPIIDNSDINFSSVKLDSRDQDILRPVSRPFNKNGGIKVLTGNLGKAVIKVSAVAEKHHKVSAQALVFNTQMEVKDAFDAGLLDRDVVVVVRGQGPKANGMPELHSLTPMLSVIQDKGFQVALVTDGRMSGASGKIPAAIHLYPEAVDGGALSKVSSGDYITIDAVAGTISADLDVVSCSTIRPSEDKQPMGFGRQLFSVLRTNSANAEMGGGINILAQSHTG